MEFEKIHIGKLKVILTHYVTKIVHQKTVKGIGFELVLKNFSQAFSRFSFSKQSVKAYIADDHTGFYWKKALCPSYRKHQNFFHITSTIASNLNKLKNYMIFCHFKLPSVPTQDKFLDFLQHDFSKLNLLQKKFLI